MERTTSRYLSDENQVNRWVKWWIIAGVVMVFLQIAIGGITRLTGSGLSITRWEIVTGTMPPIGEQAWQEAFDLYKATPQYQKINQGMSMSEFKFIYFWEYFHRLWARLMFFVFVFPYGWFLWRRMLTRRLSRRLLIVVLLAGIEGFFGWIMVASGLIKRPWVNAYNLTLHLTMGIIIFAWLLWTVFIAYQPYPAARQSAKGWRWAWTLIVLSFVQIALGAMMSGTKAGLLYPSWPDMDGSYWPAVLRDGANWTLDSFTHYDSNPFVPTLIQFLHRNMAYLLTLLIGWFVWQHWQHSATNVRMRRSYWMMLGALTLQIVLGILTLINCRGTIPVDLGVAHQAGAVLLLSTVLYTAYQWSGVQLRVHRA